VNKLNFNNLKNIDVPDSWIENALSVPEKHKKISFLSFSRIVAAVACFVVVGSASLSVFLFLNNTPDVPVSPQLPLASSSIERATEPISSALKNTFSETEKSFVSTEITEKTSLESTTVKNTEKAETHSVPTVVDPSQQHINSKPLPPMETEPVEQIPTYDTAVTTLPTFPSATQGQTTAPATVPATVHTSTQLPTNTTGNGWADIQSVGVCYGEFPKSMFSVNVYCRLYDSNGKLVGDSNLYSSQHNVHFIIESGDKIMVQYLLDKTDLNLPSGKYTYYFYNGNGIDLCQGVVFAE